MPESNNKFDPRDSLGPEFGKINSQNINPQSLQAFEGAPSNFPKVPEYYPTLDNFSAGPQTDPNINLNDSKLDKQKFNEAMANNLFQIANKQPSDHARMYSYNAGPNSDTFYKRYSSFGKEKFEQIGFNPIRDNEALFNAGTTWSERAGRMATNSLWPLFSKGFVAGPQSLFNALQGNFEVDLEQAKAYAEASAIGYDSSKGFGAFMSNTTMSFAYTAGIITEAIVEEVAGALLAPLTGGASFFAATANNARKVGKIFSGADALLDGANAVNKTLRGLDNAADARKFWQTSTGKFLNPFENVTDAWNTIRKSEKVGGNISNLSKVYRTAGGFYRDVRNANMALTEARLEGGFVERELYQELYDEHYAEFGESPDDATQKEMINQSKAAGTEALIWNTILIYGTNKILLPNLLGARGGIRKALSSKTDDILDLKTGKVIFNKTKKTKGATGAEKAIGEAFEWSEKSFIGGLKNFRKQPLGKTALGVMGYFKANVSEGLQENAQEVISEVSKAYYKQMFEDPAVISNEFNRALMSEAIDNQLSAAGLETFASGFVMGAFARPLNAALPAMSVGYNKMFDKENYQKYKDAKSQTGAAVAAKLNELYSNPKEFFDSKLFNYAVQNNADDAIKGGATKERMDSKDEALIQQILTAMDTNTMDYFKEHLSSMKDLTPEEFEEAFGFEKGTGAEYQSRIDSIIGRAESIERSYKNWKGKYPNPINLQDYEAGTEEYNKAALLNASWNMATKNAVFFGEAFENAAERMNDIMQMFSTDLDFTKVSSTDIQALFEYEPGLGLSRMNNEADMLRTSIESLEQTESLDSAGKKQLKDSKEKLKLYENYSKSFDIFMKYFFVESLDTKQMDERKASLSKELGREVTPEEFQDAIEAHYNSNRTEENNIKAKNDFEQAFKEYLKGISSLAGDHIFNKNIDEAFENLIDFYRLETESRSMAYYANLLSDPIEFKSHVEKNYEWMSDLYKNRSDYYDNMVKKAMSDVENNSLLNKLADENIYVSPEDFKRFLETGQFPEEFYDESRKKVIKETSPDYDKYASLFKMKLLMDVVDQQASNPLNKELEKKREELNKEKQDEIDALPKVETKEEATLIKKPKLRKLTIKDVIKNLNDGEYVRITYKTGNTAADKTIKTSVFYMDGQTFKHDNKEGKEVNLDTIKISIASAEKYSISLKPDPKAVEDINTVYKKKEAELIENFRNSNNNPQEYVPVTINTPVETLPSKLKEDLMTALNAEIAQTPGLYEGTDDEKLIAFMEGPVASDIITKFNQEQEALHILGQQKVPEAPIVAIDNKEIDTANMSVSKLNYYIKRYQDEIKNLEAEEKLTDSERLTLSEYKEVLADLVDYTNWKINSARPEAMQETINKIEALQASQVGITKTKNAYWINGQAHSRVTKSLEDLKENKYVYVDTAKIIGHYQVTIGQGGTVTEFMNLIKSDGSLRGFTEISYEYLTPRMEILASRINSKISKAEAKAIQISINNLDQELTAEQDPELAIKLRKQIADLEKQLPLSEDEIGEMLTNEINEATYMESRIGGTGLDGLVRDFFTNLNENFVWDAQIHNSFISKEAFNEMFGPEGSLTGLRQEVKNNNYYINAEGLILYDSTVGIAGEVDLLVVDKKGNTHIVDLKTGTKKVWSHFINADSIKKNSKVESYELQQLAYKNLLFNMTGIDASINILPVLRVTESNTGKITKAELVKELLPIDSPYWFELTPNQEIIDKVDNLIPKKDYAIEEISEEVLEVLEEPMGQDSDQVPETNVEIIGEVEYPTLDEMIGQNVYFEGKAYRLKKVNRKKKSARYELYSPTKTLYLTDVTGETTIEEAGLNLPEEREDIASKYTVQLKSEKKVIVNNQSYDIVTDKDGNIISLIPANNSKQRIKNQALIVAVEVERNKINYQEISEVNTKDELIEQEDIEKVLPEDDYITLSVINNVLNKNMSPEIADALNKLHSPGRFAPLTDQEKLILDLYVTDAIVDMSKLFFKQPKLLIGKALENLEIINILLYTGNYENNKGETSSDELSDDESTKGATEINPRKKKSKVEKKIEKDVDKKEAPVEMMTFEEIAEKIATATDISTVRGELMIAYYEKKIDSDTISKISGLLKKREQQLNESINVKLTFDNIKPGMELIVKNDIFEGKKTFAEKNQTVIVTKASSNSISIKVLGSNSSRAYENIDLINDTFTTIDLEKIKEKVTKEPLTDEEQKTVKIIEDTVDSFVQNKLFDTEADAANNQTLIELENNLLNDLDC